MFPFDDVFNDAGSVRPWKKLVGCEYGQYSFHIGIAWLIENKNTHERTMSCGNPNILETYQILDPYHVSFNVYSTIAAIRQ